MTATEPILHNIACDWITGVALDKPDQERLRPLGSALFRTEQDFGNTVRAWGLAGFKGWSCGHVQVGLRDDEVIVRCGADAAARNWRRVVEASSNVTRFDVQATVQFKGGPTREINRVRRAALRHSRENDDVPIVRWIADNRGGYTLYLGARESNVFGRVYDKFAQTQDEHFRDCVRYEVQYNSRLARIVTNQLKRSSSEIPEMAGCITRFLEARRVAIRMPFNSQLTFCLPRTASDDDRKLLWLEKAVRPSLMTLIAHGKGAEALVALGLVDEDAPQVVHMDQDTIN